MMSLMLVMTVETSHAAKPNCSDDSTHPSCGDDGGTSETTCADSTTFPAFVYWDASGGTGARLTLSDADGGCTHALTSYDNGGSITGDSALHYTPSGADYAPGSGRVIWTNKIGGTQLFLVEFAVDSDNVVYISIDSQVLAEGPWGGENGSIRHPDIAPDGDTFAFINRWPYTGVDETDGFSIYTASINGCLFAPEPWDLLDPFGCSTSLSTVFAESTATNGGFYWNDLTFNDDGTRLYVNQSIHTQENTGNPMPAGTYVVDQINNNWGDYEYEPDLPFPSTIALIDYDDSGLREVLATGGSSEFNPCGEVVVVDIADCLSDVTLCGSIIGHNLLGRDPSWLADDRLVYQERIYKRQGRNYSCKSGGMGVADPFDSSTAPVRAADGGWEPLGWRRRPPPQE
jgi:hypothetical protein